MSLESSGLLRTYRISISAVQDGDDGKKMFMCDMVQLLGREEAEKLKLTFRQTIYYHTIAARLLSKKRSTMEWTKDQNPLETLPPCRKLARHSTGDALPEYSPSPTKTIGGA